MDTQDLAKTGVFFKVAEARVLFLNRSQVVDWLHNKAAVDTEISNSEFVRFHFEIRNVSGVGQQCLGISLQ